LVEGRTMFSVVLPLVSVLLLTFNIAGLDLVHN
jgi:hypothetical protein